MTTKTSLTIAAIVMAAAALVYVGTLDAQQVRHESSLYCEMVELYQASGGDYGWPAYRGEGECQ